MVDAAAVWARLASVTDPEFPVSVVDLGMVYGVRVREGSVEVDLTFTSIGCPAMDLLVEDVRAAVQAVPGVEQVRVNVVWSPPWTKQRLTERGRRILSMYGVVG